MKSLVNFGRNEDMFWKNFGYSYAGILYLGFLNWLKDKLIESNISEVFFFARDGWIMEKTFDIIFPNSSSNVHTHYLYSSRRMFNIASLEILTNDDINFFLSGSTILTVKEYLNRIGVTFDKARDVVKAFGLSGDEFVDSELKKEQIKEIFFDLEESILENAKLERENLIKYLKLNYVFDFNNIALVDIGWFGSMQYSLNKILRSYNSNTQLKGLYLGTFMSETTRDLNMEAFLFNKQKPIEYFELVYKCVEVFELLFSSSEPSVLSVEVDNSNVLMKFDVNDNNIDKITILNDIHNSALNFIKDNRLFYSGSNAKIANYYKDRIYETFHRLLFEPTFEEVVKIGNINHAEGFGQGTKLRPIVIMKPIEEYYSDLTKVVNDYKNSFWRTGFTKYLYYEQRNRKR